MKILFTAEYDENYLDELNIFGEVNIQGWAKGLNKLSEDELVELASDVDIIITSYDDITKRVIDSAPNLKLIACTRATPVNIDVNYAKEKGVKVIYTPGRNSDSTAEHTIALMLSIARKIPMAHKALKEGKFTSDTSEKGEIKSGLKEDVVWGIDNDSPYVVFKGTQLKGKTLGIIGYGSIGRRVGDIASAFGMNILIYDPFVSEIDVNRIGREKVSLQTLLAQSDFITVHLKATPETKGLFNEAAFKSMKNTAYFINCARAAVVDEEALIHALRTKEIAGAALDVFSKEPIYRDHPFISELDNVVITPHIAGATNDVLSNHTQMIIQEVRRYLNNEPLLYEYK
ncbi:2-hydroxyacid dehydrogenase [Paenibacillus donghaensis]|uniref:2-hydroxyacid dehydrogenase n=1 Tax=Paenibacillus donghaensis TaxID=414771 RepID=UPI00188372B3|nr:2-hydroxyacid dehydrogenase [Paenibacillus donghaensis]MBE9912423.1 2-hydroxyacid dehydrogenase [Paenibacillus donghaensis]